MTDWTGACKCGLCGLVKRMTVMDDPGLLGSAKEPVLPIECPDCGNQSMMPEGRSKETTADDDGEWGEI